MHCLGNFPWVPQVLRHIHPPPTSADLLCQLLEADGSPLCGGPIGAFPDMGVPRVRLGREDYGHSGEGIWVLLGDAQEFRVLVAAHHAQPSALEGRDAWGWGGGGIFA